MNIPQELWITIFELLDYKSLIIANNLSATSRGLESPKDHGFTTILNESFDNMLKNKIQQDLTLTNYNRTQILNMCKFYNKRVI